MTVSNVAGQLLSPCNLDTVFQKTSGVKLLWNQLSPVGPGDRLCQSLTRLPGGRSTRSPYGLKGLFTCYNILQLGVLANLQRTFLIS